MRMSEVEYGTTPHIDGYGAGFFRVAGEVHEGPLLLLPNGVTAWAGFEDLTPVLAAVDEIDVLFLGTGAEIAHPPKAFQTACDEVGLGIELMASPTACRTFNVLLSEGRRANKFTAAAAAAAAAAALLRSAEARGRPSKSATAAHAQ